MPVALDLDVCLAFGAHAPRGADDATDFNPARCSTLYIALCFLWTLDHAVSCNPKFMGLWTSGSLDPC